MDATNIYQKYDIHIYMILQT